MHYDCSTMQKGKTNKVAYSLKLSRDMIQSLLVSLNNNETCEIEFGSGENERDGVL